MKSRHLLNLSVQNALDCLSDKFNLKNFPEGACSRNSLEKCATRSSDGRYRVHIATVYYISRSPLSQNPPVAPYLSPGLFIFFSASHSVNCIGLKRYRFSPLFWWGWRTCSHALQITTDRGIVLVVHPMANELFSKETCHVQSERLNSIPSNVCPCYARVPKLKLTWCWFNGTWRCLWGVYKQFAHLAKRYHVAGFTSWCSLFFAARRSEKYDTLPKTSTAGVNWLPPAGTIRIDPHKSLLPQQLYCIMIFLAPTTKLLGSQTPSYTSLNVMVLIGNTSSWTESG